MIRAAMTVAVCALTVSSANVAFAGPYDAMISAHAAANGVPESLVHRVIIRESRYRPHVISKGNYGMMQIRLGTARGLGYTGTAQGLLDANTNLTYAVKYLAGAYRAAHGNHDLAVRYYAGGYYYAAKRQGWNSNAQRVNTPATPFEVASTSATERAPAAAAVVDVAGSVAPPGSRAYRREVRAEAEANARNELRPTGPVFNPFKDMSKPKSAKAAATTNPLAALFAPAQPQPQPVQRHRSRKHRG